MKPIVALSCLGLLFLSLPSYSDESAFTACFAHQERFFERLKELLEREDRDQAFEDLSALVDSSIRELVDLRLQVLAEERKASTEPSLSMRATAVVTVEPDSRAVERLRESGILSEAGTVQLAPTSTTLIIRDVQPSVDRAIEFVRGSTETSEKHVHGTVETSGAKFQFVVKNGGVLTIKDTRTSDDHELEIRSNGEAVMIRPCRESRVLNPGQSLLFDGGTLTIDTVEDVPPRGPVVPKEHK